MPNNRRASDRRKAAYAGLLLLGSFVLGACTKPGMSGKVTEQPVPTLTEAPEPTLTGGAGQPSHVPAATPTAELTPEGTQRPTQLPSLMPTTEATAVPTTEPVKRATVTPTVKPAVTVTPMAKPTVTTVPLPTQEPLPTNEPIPTETPEYDTLIRNGWQRTEDFFGQREVYFSGKFDTVELLAVDGRYEYRYSASADMAVSFSIIGETGKDIHSFMRELTAQYPDCVVTAEGDADYSYWYTSERQIVSGRTYDCTGEGQTSCMRVELRYPAGDTQYGNEGYVFYLR